MSYLTTLLKNKIDIDNIIKFQVKHNLNINDKYILSQEGGDIYSLKIDDINYSVNYSINKNDDNSIIYFELIKPIENIYYCFMATYYDNNILNINIIANPKLCILSDKKILDENLKYGDIMMKIIINYAKDNNFKIIKGEDENKISYDIKYVHTLYSGFPWYYKYNFKYNERNDNHVKYNKNKLDIMKTNDLDYNILINIIKDEYKELNKELENKIKKLYEKYKDQQIYIFFYKLTRKFCFIMSLIYYELFKILDLKFYDNNIMILNLN